jgi:chromosome partitioning protein
VEGGFLRLIDILGKVYPACRVNATVALDEVLSEAFHKHVLVIDLDPQTNATSILIGDDKWAELNKKGHTVATLFKDALDGTSNFDLIFPQAVGHSK